MDGLFNNAVKLGSFESNAHCFKNDLPALANPDLQHFKMYIFLQFKNNT